MSEKRLFVTPRGAIGYSLKTPYRGGTLKVIASIEDPPVIERILNHRVSQNLPGLSAWFTAKTGLGGWSGVARAETGRLRKNQRISPVDWR